MEVDVDKRNHLQHTAVTGGLSSCLLKLKYQSTSLTDLFIFVRFNDTTLSQERVVTDNDLLK